MLQGEKDNERSVEEVIGRKDMKEENDDNDVKVILVLVPGGEGKKIKLPTQTEGE